MTRKGILTNAGWVTFFSLNMKSGFYCSFSKQKSEALEVPEPLISWLMSEVRKNDYVESTSCEDLPPNLIIKDSESGWYLSRFSLDEGGTFNPSRDKAFQFEAEGSALYMIELLKSIRPLPSDEELFIEEV